MSARLLALRHPQMVARLVLAGTLPPIGTPEVIPASPEWGKVATKPDYDDADVLFLFFTDSAASKAAGMASLRRIAQSGKGGPAVKTKMSIVPAQIQAITGFAKNEGNWYAQLKDITQPALIANGDQDRAFPVIDSVVLAREIPNGQLAIYPDAGHGFLFQYPERFAADAMTFFNSTA